MFEIPGRDDIERVVIDEAVIRGDVPPHIYGGDGVVLTWNNNGKLNPAA
jgi:ATP-dependent protease Clp ATPase subunit